MRDNVLRITYGDAEAKQPRGSSTPQPEEAPEVDLLGFSEPVQAAAAAAEDVAPEDLPEAAVEFSFPGPGRDEVVQVRPPSQ